MTKKKSITKINELKKMIVYKMVGDMILNNSSYLNLNYWAINPSGELIGFKVKPLPYYSGNHVYFYRNHEHEKVKSDDGKLIFIITDISLIESFQQSNKILHFKEGKLKWSDID